MAKMGRPKIDNPMLQKVTIRLDNDTILQLQEYSKKEKISKSAIVRQALTQFWQKK